MSDKNNEENEKFKEIEEKSACEKAENSANESCESDINDESSGESGSESSGSGKSIKSDSGAECPICLRGLTTQNIGYPEDCASIQHIFCAVCIEEWSKNVTTCPIDRREFSSICILESYKNQSVVRKIKVVRKEYNEEEVVFGETEEDLTYCEICHRANREHMMLLCDDCDKGFHIDCLTPALREIPTGSWFCPRCDPDTAADNASVSAESDVDLPRIIRTRHSERIRTAILRNHIDVVQPIVEAGPSNRNPIQSTLDRIRRRLTARRTRRKYRRRRRRVRVTVDEYDVNSGNEKFPIKRTSRVIRRRRKIKKGKRKSKRSKCAADNEQPDVYSERATKIRASVPRLRLFEPANSLDYFSDEHEEEPPAETAVQNMGNVMTIIRNVRPVGSSRTLLKRKVAIAAPTPDPVNILDIIMQSQENMYSTNKKPPQKKQPQITQAPLNNGTESQQIQAKETTTQNSATTESRQQNTGFSQSQEGNSGAGTTSVSGSGGRENGGAFRYSYVAPLPQRNQTPKKTQDMFEEEENCPNFSVYSSETMNLAKGKADEEKPPEVEMDVDLVQLSGEEDEVPPPEEDLQPAAMWKPITEEPQPQKDERSRVLELYDSDGDNLEEWNKETENPAIAANDEQQPERSYTPCLDENHPKETEMEAPSKPASTGIDGMDTELISEEEDSNLNEHLEPFKRSNNKTKDRNYRDKQRSKSPPPRRSGSADDKENKDRRHRGTRKELPRYDVRNVIAKVSQRDPFGRNKERNKSRSRSAGGGSRSRSSKTPGSRRSFTISRSPSYDRPRKKKSGSPRKRSVTPRRRNSPVPPSRRRSTSRSVSRHSPSPKLRRRDLPVRRRSESPPKKRRGRGRDKPRKKRQRVSRERKRNKERSLSRGWSRNLTPGTPPVEQSWTPPITGQALPKTAENLRVVVNNREEPVRGKKKEKRKKNDKKKEKRKERNKRRPEKAAEPTNRAAAAASKEVFASGDNILVSVSFNNVQEKQKTPDRRVERDPTKVLQLPAPQPTRPTQRRHRKTDAKPVAIIDLDGSPFNEIPPSPVIILSDSDHDHDSGQQKNGTEITLDEVIRPGSPPESPTAEEQFRAPAGPKTPPEPPQTIKFSMQAKTNRMRQINTIFEQENDASDETSQNESQKIGPNTPPEPTPTSPDVYDPFEPTKSPSEHSDGNERDNGAADDGPASRSSTPPLEETEANLSKEAEKSAALNPVDLVMSLINKSTSNLTLHEQEQNQTITIESMDEITEKTEDNTGPIEKHIQVISNVIVTPMKGGGGGVQYLHPIGARTTATSTTQPHRTPNKSPAIAGYKPQMQNVSKSSKTHQTGGSIISKLPLPRKPTQAEIATVDIIDSPYSPGSSDFDDLFEPPSSTTDTYKPLSLHKQPNVTSTSNNNRGGNVGNNAGAAGKVEIFDNLFGSISPVHKFSTVTSTYKTTAKVTRRRKRRSRKQIDDDEIPSSAVELQVKDKLLRKLNRQERVIEEVKLVIKPHYNKKRITKEEYKEIMRKAVPKVYHSKSGEINPVKISALVEAYVKKVRYRRKKAQTT